MDAAYRIVSDGTPANTHIYDQTGKELTFVTVIDWSISSDNISKATIQLSYVAIEAIGILAKDNCLCRHAIENWDGIHHDQRCHLSNLCNEFSCGVRCKLEAGHHVKGQPYHDFGMLFHYFK